MRSVSTLKKSDRGGLLDKRVVFLIFLLFLMFVPPMQAGAADPDDIIPDIIDQELDPGEDQSQLSDPDPSSEEVQDPGAASGGSIQLEDVADLVSGVSVQVEEVHEDVTSSAVRLDALEQYAQDGAESMQEIYEAVMAASGSSLDRMEELADTVSGSSISYDDTDVIRMLRDIRTELVRVNKYLAFVYIFGIIALICFVCVFLYRLFADLLRGGDIM